MRVVSLLPLVFLCVDVSAYSIGVDSKSASSPTLKSAKAPTLKSSKLAPTASPTISPAPTVSPAPSSSPTISPAPSVSPAPTESPVPKSSSKSAKATSVKSKSRMLKYSFDELWEEDGMRGNDQ